MRVPPGGAPQVLERVQDGVEDRPRQVHARPALLAVLLQQAGRLELAHRAARGGVGDAEHLLRLGTVMHGVRKSSSASSSAWPLTQGAERACCPMRARAWRDGALGRLGTPFTKKSSQGVPLAVRAHALQAQVVLVAVTLEVGGEVQQRPAQARRARSGTG